MNPTLSNELGNLPCLYLQVKNSGATAIDIGLDNVTATSAGKPVSFFSASSIAKAIKKQAAAQAFAVALGAGLQQAGAAIQASTPSYSTTYGSANVYNPYKAPTTVNYTAHTTTYNPAAKALGISKFAQFYKIILPQMLRLAIPNLSNVWQITLKDTSLISVTGLVEIMRQSYIAAGSTRDPLFFYCFAAVLYLMLTFLSMKLINRLEVKYSRSF